MSRDQAHWLAGTLLQHCTVASTTRLEAGVVEVERNNLPKTIIGIVSGFRISGVDVQSFIDCASRPHFIVLIPNKSIWTGDAIEQLVLNKIGFGKMYDLYRALRQCEDLSEYESPEIFYTERIFRQHGNVSGFEKVTDRSYRIQRHVGKDVIVAFSQDYEMTADAVRLAYDLYAPFDILLKTTPYGGISKSGRTVAEELGIKVTESSGLYKYLNLAD